MVSITQSKMNLTYTMVQVLVPYLRDCLMILDQYQMRSLDMQSKTQAQESSLLDAARSSLLDAVSENLDENENSVDGGSVFDDANTQKSSSRTTPISSDDDEAVFTTTDFMDILK
jgi:hypothetical protein